MIRRGNWTHDGNGPLKQAGRETGVRYALVGLSIVLAWLILCLTLQRVF